VGCNKRLQPLTMSATTSSQTVFSIGYDFHLGNGDNGNVFGITNYKDANRNQTFTYDGLNRVTSAQNAGTDCTAKVLQNKTEYWGNNYTYDAWGNLLGKTVTKCSAENLGVTADAHNWIHISPNDYQYDVAGNMTYDATENANLSYDQENRITGANGYTYTYDGDGNRVRKSNGNTASSGTLYWEMSPGVMAETDLAGTTKSEYVFFDGERVARRDGATGAGGVFYYFSDHLKTASVITDSAGVIKAESDYYPWGGELQFVNNDSNDYKFTGKKRDTETGLDYFGARYYSNGLGRWVSADWSATPIPVPYADFGDPQSLNLYQFVGGNPASKADPDGHWPTAGDFGKWLDRQIDKFESTKLGHAYATGTSLVGNPMPFTEPLAAARFVSQSAQIGNATGNALGGDHTTMEKVDAIAHDTKAAGELIIVLATAGKGMVPEVATPRLPQDVNVNPKPPAANNGNGTVGPSGSQNATAQADAAAARGTGHTDIRMNQQQVNAQGQRVGVNRPDLQSTDANGVRHYTEYDRSAQNAADHHARTTANDPNGVTHTKIGP
jgi:RHS repeat-associated protein